MAIVPMIFADTPQGGFEVHTCYAPKVGEHCSKAQDEALRIFAKTRKDWGLSGIEVVHVHASIEDALNAARGVA